MEAAVVLCAFTASMLTFFSGFGLGTMMLPVFSLFVPIPIAVAMTACLHLFSNLMKFFLVGSYADKKTVIFFGVPAIIGAVIGARCLQAASAVEARFILDWNNASYMVDGLGITVGILIVFFALYEFLPLSKAVFTPKWMGLGGLMSGFLGGFSGHQGALRSAFLLRAGLDKKTFIATGVWIACLVDISRLTFYGKTFLPALTAGRLRLIAFAMGASLGGVLIGRFFLEKTKLIHIQFLVSFLLGILGALLMIKSVVPHTAQV